MNKSTNHLHYVLSGLIDRARQYGLNDTQWAAKAGLPKETLSRLRRRHNCDFTTLTKLANAVNGGLYTIQFDLPHLTADRHFPIEINRDYEESLLRLCASRSLALERWTAIGPNFFMGGLAVMLASVDRFDRCGLLMLSEKLSPGISKPDVFARWLELSPLRPSRFLPMLEKTMNDET